MSELFGREAELNQLRDAWASTARLITLAGPIGVGKSALARTFAENIPSLRRVDLAEARTEHDVLSSIARALGNADADEAWSIESLDRDHTALLFDPVERMLEPVREILSRWLTLVPTLRVLCVTRERFGRDDEEVIALAPLDHESAAKLFVRAAKMDSLSNDDHVRVLRIVARLSCLPLSILLAARRTDLLSLHELEARLQSPLAVLKGDAKEATETHASLRVAVQWSWEGLSDTERAFLTQLHPAAFGFRFDVAEALVGNTEQALDLLDSLSRKHLIFSTGRHEERRFHIMDAVRDFAIEQSSHDERVKAQHAFRLATLNANEAKSTDPNERDTLLQLADDCLAAEPEFAARALLLAHPTAFLRGPFERYAALLEQAIESNLPPATLARLELSLGELRRERGDTKGASAALQLAATHATSAEPLNAPPTTLWADATRLLGVIARMSGDTASASQLVTSALQVYKRVKDDRRSALALGDLGSIQLASGHLVLAKESLRRAVELHRRGDPKALGPALSYLGIATHRLGHFEEAIRLHEEARHIHEALGHVRYLAAECAHIGYCHHELGHNEAAREHFDAAIHHATTAQDSLLYSVALIYSARVDLEASSFDAAESKLERALAAAQDISHARLEATALTALGHHGLARDDFAAAKTFYERALTRSTASEVGFERLTPGYLALTLSKLGQSESASAKLAECLRATRDHESPLVREAARFLEMLVKGEPISKNRAASSEGRWIQRLGKSSTPSVSLAISSDGERIVLTGEPFDMKRRGALRRILVALVDHRREGLSSALDWKQLAEAGWPGEKMRTEAAIKRVYTAVWTLRKMGLGEHLVTRDDGYFLSEALEIRDLQV